MKCNHSRLVAGFADWDVLVDLITILLLSLQDEPTSGLDATTALHLMITLRHLATGGRAIATTIHQPSSRLYQQLDSLMLLAEGHVVYYGRAQEVVPWFGALGFALPYGVNVADFLLDLAQGEVQGVVVEAASGGSHELGGSSDSSSCAATGRDKGGSCGEEGCTTRDSSCSGGGGRDICCSSSVRGNTGGSSCVGAMSVDGSMGGLCIAVGDSGGDQGDAKERQSNQQCGHQVTPVADCCLEVVGEGGVGTASNGWLATGAAAAAAGEGGKGGVLVGGAAVRALYRSYEAFELRHKQGFMQDEQLADVKLVLEPLLYGKGDGMQGSAVAVGIGGGGAYPADGDGSKDSWRGAGSWGVRRESSRAGGAAASLTAGEGLKDSWRGDGGWGIKGGSSRAAASLTAGAVTGGRGRIDKLEAAAAGGGGGGGGDDRDWEVSEIDQDLGRSISRAFSWGYSCNALRSGVAATGRSGNGGGGVTVNGGRGITHGDGGLGCLGGFAKWQGMADRGGASYLTQLRVLMLRNMKIRRFESLSGQRFLQLVAVAVITGLFWFQRGAGNSLLAAQDVAGLLFFEVLFPSFGAMYQALFTFPKEFQMLLKERASGMYRVSAFYAASAASDLPMDCALPVLFVVMIYLMGGLRMTAGAFFANVFAIVLLVLTAQVRNGGRGGGN